MNKNALIRLFKYIGSYKRFVLASLLCAVLSVISSLIGPFLIGKSIDKMTGAGKVNFNYLLKILVILAFVYALGNFFGWILTYLTNCISYQSSNQIRKQLFEKLNSLPLKFYDTNPHGDIISRFINDVDTVGDGMLQSMSTLLTGIITILGALVFMFFISPIMTVVVILSTPISFFVTKFITTRSKQMFKEQAKSLGELNGYVEEMIGGQKVVQSFNFQKPSFEKFKKINSELYKSGVKSQFYGSLANPSTRLVNNITYSIIGVFGGVAAILGKITIGDISSFLIYSTLFAKPFNDITAVLTQLQSAAASAQRIFNVLDMEPEKNEYDEILKVEVSRGNIKFDNVNFSYNKQNPLIRNFNLNVKSASKVAIVGKTGAGKTTLVNLLMRFYDIDSGNIYIDDMDISKLSRENVRRNFGMVLQDTWLFAGTIRDNIAYGKSNATEKEIIEAAKAANAHSFIRRLPNGYDTLLTDAGENLSQGQKQLLTIARVMLVNPPMLILDEATSSIDTRTEIHIQSAFLKMIEGRTSFVIAHRLSTIKESDLILVMDNGNIVESGTHEQLLNKGGYYTKLYNSQFAAV